MAKNKWFWLQLFAGEGAGASGGGEGGGDGAVSGDNGVAAEHQRLLELGVPEEKLIKRAKRASAKLPEGAVATAPKEVQEQKPQEQVATAEENPTEEKTETTTPARMSWDEIMADPEYNKQMQATIKSRLKSAGAAEEALTKMAPALEVLARKHGQDPTNPDYEALAKAIYDDDAYYEDKALEMGVSVETAKKLDQEELDRAREKRTEERNLEQQMLQNHFVRLEQQGEALKKVFPNFDLRTELQNPAFARMVAPGKGIMSVEDAYKAVHRKEIEAAQSQVIAQQTTQKISNAIQAGSRRPDENGTSGQSASVTTFDYSKASRDQRNALKQQIRAAAARGEKLYPGR
jgi:hypothetical protein